MLCFARALLPQGPEFSCYTIAHNGRVVAHADTSASVSNLNYKNVGRQDINDWVDAFCTRSGASGQVGGMMCEEA